MMKLLQLVLTPISIVLMLTASAQSDSSDVFDLSSSDVFESVIADKQNVYTLISTNKGYVLHTFNKSSLKKKKSVEIDDRVEKVNIEFLIAGLVGDDAVLFFKGYDRKDKQEVVLALRPASDAVIPEKWAGFPGSGMREGKFDINFRPGSEVISILFLPDRPSTREQVASFAVVKNGKELSSHTQVFEHKGELVQFDDHYADEQGNLWIPSRKFTTIDAAGEKYIREKATYENVLYHLPPGGKSLKVIPYPENTKLLYESKIVQDRSSGDVKIIGLVSKYHTVLSTGIVAYDLDTSGLSLTGQLEYEFGSEIIDSMKTTEMSAHIRKKKGYPDSDKPGVYAISIADVVLDDEKLFIVAEEKRWVHGVEMAALSSYDSGVSSDFDYYYHGACLLLKMHGGKISGFAFLRRDISILEKEYRNYASRICYDPASATIHLAYKEDKGLYGFSGVESNGRARLAGFHNLKYTPDPWKMWLDVDDLFTIRKDRKEFIILRLSL